MKFMGARSSYELQWLDFKIGHYDGSPSKRHQGDMTYSIILHHALIHSCIYVL